MQLGEEQIFDLYALVEICKSFDKTTPPIYWNSIQNRKSDVYCDFYYTDLHKNIIGYLGLFFFEDDMIEVIAFVHPFHRQQGIFKALFLESVHTLVLQKAAAVRFLCPQNSKSGVTVLKKIKANYLFSDYKLQFTHLDQLAKLPTTPLEFQTVSLDDIPTLATLEVECFDENKTEMIARFNQILMEPNRKAWLATFDNKPIGKIHVRMEDNIAIIHNECLLPKYRKKSYEQALLTQAINWLITNHPNFKIIIDVQDYGLNTLKFYKNMGFSILEGHDVWESSLSLHHFIQPDMIH